MTDTTFNALGKGPMPADRDGLETIDRKQWGRVTFSSGELVAQCPVTGQPDMYFITISLEGFKTLESKSLKLYLWSWHGEAIFAEHLSDQIAADLSRALEGGTVDVELTQNIRGGITTTVRSHVGLDF